MESAPPFISVITWKAKSRRKTVVSASFTDVYSRKPWQKGTVLYKQGVAGGSSVEPGGNEKKIEEPTVDTQAL